MNDIDKKLQVLSDIAHILNENNVIWAVGGSLLLYFKGKADFFQDIDLMIFEDHIDTVKNLLSSMGRLEAPNLDAQYRTRHFMEFTIVDIDVDVIGGFVIVKDNQEYDCSLLPEQIVEYIHINDEDIPLQSLDDWRRYYTYMGRMDKVEMIG